MFASAIIQIIGPISWRSLQNQWEQQTMDRLLGKFEINLVALIQTCCPYFILRLMAEIDSDTTTSGQKIFTVLNLIMFSESNPALSCLSTEHAPDQASPPKNHCFIQEFLLNIFYGVTKDQISHSQNFLRSADRTR